MNPELQAMSQIPQQGQSQLLEWRMHPFQMVHGIEVLDNMRERGYNESHDRERPLEYSFKGLRDGRILVPPYDKATFVAAIGRSNGGKSSFNQGMYRVAFSDQHLHAILASECVSFDIVPVPFSLYAEAAKTQKVYTQHPEFAVAPEVPHGEYSEDDYARISGLMMHDVEEHILARQGEGQATVVLLEPSCPTAIPSRENPGIAQGIDRGLTPVYSLAANEKTRGSIEIFAIDLNEEVSEEVVVFRGKINDEHADLRNVFHGNINVVFTDYEEMTEGDDLPVDTLPLSTQKKVQDFLQRVMAPPSAKARSDAELDALIAGLKQDGQIGSSSDRRFFRFIQQRLGIPNSQFHYLSNPHLLGWKTFDIDYFIHSLPIRLYPEILNT